MKCKYCDSENIIMEARGTATGAYCKECGKWLKWLTKNEIRVLKNKQTSINKNNISLYEKAIKKWGTPLQIIMAIEEMVELTKELIKELRDKGNWGNIVEEIADVHIMLKQLQIAFYISEETLNEMISTKLAKLENLLKEKN